MENLRKKNCIRTNSGIYFNIIKPTEKMIDINDIAHSLSMQCRFGGHISEFYSVAQHSVLCCMIAKPEYKKQALMHDSSEAYLLDIPTPIKNELLNYKELEQKIEKLICNKYKIQYPYDKEIKILDETILLYEWNSLILKNKICKKQIVCWDHETAKNEFLNLYYTLFKN